MRQPYVMQFPSSKVPTGVSEWGWGKGPWSDVADFAFAVSQPIRHDQSFTYTF